MRRAVILIVSLLVGSIGLVAESGFEGRVVYLHAEGRGLPGIKIEGDGKAVAETGSDGRFVFANPKGDRGELISLQILESSLSLVNPSAAHWQVQGGKDGESNAVTLIMAPGDRAAKLRRDYYAGRFISVLRHRLAAQYQDKFEAPENILQHLRDWMREDVLLEQRAIAAATLLEGLDDRFWTPEACAIVEHFISGDSLSALESFEANVDAHESERSEESLVIRAIFAVLSQQPELVDESLMALRRQYADRFESRLTIAELGLVAGMTELGLESARDSQDLASKMKDPIRLGRARQILARYAEMDRRDEDALKLLEQSWTDLSSSNPQAVPGLTDLMKQTADQLARLDLLEDPLLVDLEVARRIEARWQNAVRNAPHFHELGWADSILDLADEYGKLDLPDRSKSEFDRAETLLMSIRDTTDRPTWLREMNDVLDGLARLLNHQLQRAASGAVRRRQIEGLRKLVEAGDAESIAGLIAALGAWSNVSAAIGMADAAIEQSDEAVALARRYAQLDSTYYEPILAERLLDAGFVATRAGRPESAERFYQEALEIFRGLVSRKPERHAVSFATLLNNLGVGMADQDRVEEAESAYRESIGILLGQQWGGQDHALKMLPLALSNLGRLLGRQLRADEARDVFSAAIDQARSLAAESPDYFLGALGDALDGLARVEWEVNAVKRAEELYQESIFIRRHLSELNPPEFRLELSASLRSYAAMLADRDRFPEAKKFAEESVEIARGLAMAPGSLAARPLSASLHDLGYVLSASGDVNGARSAYAEALNLLRQMLAQHPEIVASSAYGTMFSLAEQLRKLRRFDESRSLAEESVEGRRALLETNPSDRELRFDLAISLGALANVQVDQGAFELAAIQQAEAISILRDLDVDGSSQHRVHLARLTYNHGNVLLRLEDPRALSLQREAVDLYRELYSQEPDQFAFSLMNALVELGLGLDEREPPKSAEATLEEARRILSEFQSNPGAVDRRNELAKLQSNIGRLDSRLGHTDRALESARSGVEIREQLFRENPVMFREDYATELRFLGLALRAVGDVKGVAETFRASAKHYEDLARNSEPRFFAEAALVWHNLAILYLDQESDDEAVAPLERIVEIAVEQEHAGVPVDEDMLGVVLVDLGLVAWRSESLAQARTYLGRAVELGRKLLPTRGDDGRHHLAERAYNYGWVCSDERDYPAAEISFEEALLHYRLLAKAGDPKRWYNVMQALDGLILSKEGQREFEGLEPLVLEVVRIREEQIALGRPDQMRALGESLISLTLFAAGRGDFESAVKHAERGLGIFEELQKAGEPRFGEQIEQLKRILARLQVTRSGARI